MSTYYDCAAEDIIEGPFLKCCLHLRYCDNKSILNFAHGKHEPVIAGPGKNAIKLLPWNHTLIANAKCNIRGVYQGVSSKHLGRYLAEFCYRFSRRLSESQMFGRLLTACLNCATIRLAELRV